MKGISLYCFQRQNSWYFRKRVLKQYTHHNKEISFKISLKKLLGNQNYYKAVLQGSLFTITNYLNNNIELFLFQKGKITLAELTDFCIKILNKYEQEALMLKNDFVNELGTRKKEIEEKRFASLDFYDENSRLWAGHTPQALDKEIGVLQEAYDSKDRSLLSKKAKDILNRQDILSKDELTQLEFLSLSEKVDFEEALVKKEIIVLNQDKLNYNAIFGKKEQSNSNGINEEKLLDLLAQHPDFKIAVQNIKAQKQDERDNWDYLINSFLDDHMTNANEKRLRGEDVAVIQFKQMLLGDKAFYVDLKTIEGTKKKYLTETSILNATREDMKALKMLFLDLPNLTNTKDNSIIENWRENGIIYTIFITKKDREKYPKIFLSGIKSKIKVIMKFLKFIKITEKKYKDLNLLLWEETLKVDWKDLSPDDKQYNEENSLEPFLSEYINGFLINRYKDEESKRAGTAQRNFTRHTSASPHIFWSLMLGIYTGARAEELAQLRLRDIKKSIIEEESIYYIHFCITDYKNQSIKNLSSSRITPLHNNLIEIGFLNYVQDRINQKADYLFDLKINKDKKRKEFQRSFNDDIKKYMKNTYPNLDNYRYSFHGLRSHFISKFLKSNIVFNDIDELENKASLNELIELKKLVGHTANKLEKDTTISTYFREDLELLGAKRKINDIDFFIVEGYEIVRELMLKKIGEPIRELNI